MANPFGQIITSLAPELLETLPAMNPPPGIVPNFVNPYSKGPTLVIISSVTLFLSLLFFAIRLYTKAYIVRKVGWDDLMATLGLLSAIAVYIGHLWGALYGSFGKHQWNVSIAQVLSHQTTVPTFLDTAITPPMLGFIKVAFFLLYLELFWPMRWLRISVYVGLTINVVFYTAITVTQIALSVPRKGETWQLHEVSPLELKAEHVAIPLAAGGLVVDIYLLILPMLAVIQLQLPKRRKIGFLLVFSTGLLASIGSLLSVYFRCILLKSSDITWNILNVQIMATVEANIGIMCLCMPNVSKLFSQHMLAINSLRSRWSSRWSLLRSKFARKSTSGTTKVSTDASSPTEQKSAKPMEDSQGTRVTGTTLVETTQLSQQSRVRSFVESEVETETQKDEALDEIIRHYTRERSVDVQGFPNERTWSV